MMAVLACDTPPQLPHDSDKQIEMKPWLLPVLLLLLHQLHLLVAQTHAKLTTGSSYSSLKPPANITSSSGDFAFGFRALDSNPGQYLLAVWFHIAEQTVVWFAKQSGSTVIATEQSVFSLTNDGQLSLDDAGGSKLWTNADPSNQMSGSVLVLQDSGNLQFLDDGGSVVWESFQHPSDTLLPGQFMRSRTKIFSKLTDTNFSAGRFCLYVQADSDIVLYQMSLPGSDVDPQNPYWATGTYRASQDGNTTLFFDKPGHLYYRLKDGNRTDLTSALQTSTASYYQRATLDPDGVVRVWIRPRRTTAAMSNTWLVGGQFPIDPCTITTSSQLPGLCGPNSYCMYTDGRPNCECPSGYSFFDAQYRYRGCKADFVPHSCDGKNHSAEFELTELPNTTWSNSKYQEYWSITEERCRDLCLSDCICAAAVFDGKNCEKMSTMTAGWQTNDTNSKALIKVRISDPRGRGHVTLRSMLPYIVIGCLAFLLLFAIGFLLVHYCYLSKRAKRSLLSVRVFTYTELKQATNGFKELLGKGGFGKVYKGKVNSAQSDVAVKKLNQSDDYKVEFTNEVQSIGQIHHRNLVRMIGHCKEGKHRILVFEFMSGGSLGDFMKRSGRPPWSWLAEAAQGIARGLEYLHDGCTIPIIHCDIKPDNILLDHNLAPRITDFGISKLLKDQKLQYTITKIMGTKGYLAPEWFDGSERVDNKVDVYSFGVVLLEMICWKKTLEEHPPDDQNAGTAAMLKDWAESLIREGRTELLVQGEGEALQDMESVERFARVAIWCVQKDPLVRPTMRKVVLMLEGTMEVDPLPDPTRPPGFSAILSVGNGTNDSHGMIRTLQIE